MFVCSHHFSDECFVNKAQFDAGFADCLILKVGAAPVMKVPCHESETQAVSKTASNFCFVCSRRVSAYSASGKYSQHFTFCTFCYVTALCQNEFNVLFSSKFYKQYPIMTT